MVGGAKSSVYARAEGTRDVRIQQSSPSLLPQQAFGSTLTPPTPARPYVVQEGFISFALTVLGTCLEVFRGP